MTCSNPACQKPKKEPAKNPARQSKAVMISYLQKLEKGVRMSKVVYDYGNGATESASATSPKGKALSIINKHGLSIDDVCQSFTNRWGRDEQGEIRLSSKEHHHFKNSGEHQWVEFIDKASEAWGLIIKADERGELEQELCATGTECNDFDNGECQVWMEA